MDYKNAALSAVPTPLEWVDKRRPFKKGDKQVFVTLALILILVGIILFFLRQFSFLAALFAAFFVYWALNTTEPADIKYRIDDRGIWIGGVLYDWSRLTSFWHQEKDGYHLFFIKAKGVVTGVIILTLSRLNLADEITQRLSQKLETAPPPNNITERLLAWSEKKINLNQTQT